MYHGIVNVYKERGYTSHDVVARMRGICGQKKIGHTGTLDPEAEGVLPVCLGSATKVCGMLTDSDKEYRAVMLLGVETDTQDLTGTVLRRGDVSGLRENDVRDALGAFTGVIQQIPPMYSARKVNGKKLCDLARAGVTVERQPREVTIYSIDAEKFALPRVTMTVRCSKGTYIRTLCHEIGRKLGCGAAMESLVRIQAAGYRLEDSLSLRQLEELRDAGALAAAIHPLDEVFSMYPAFTVRAEADRFLKNGNALRPGQLVSGSGGTGLPDGSERAAQDSFSSASRAWKKDGCSFVSGTAGQDCMTSGSASGQRDGAVESAELPPAGVRLSPDPEQRDDALESAELLPADVRFSSDPGQRDGAVARVYSSSGQFSALYRYDAEKRLFCPVKMFLGD